MIIPNTDWMEDGACRGHANTELWFSNEPEDIETTKAICQGCPVRLICLDYAVSELIVYGTWGGQSQDERRRVRRKRWKMGRTA